MNKQNISRVHQETSTTEPSDVNTEPKLFTGDPTGSTTPTSRLTLNSKKFISKLHLIFMFSVLFIIFIFLVLAWLPFKFQKRNQMGFEYLFKSIRNDL